ncbi:uncharacterized protein LOC135709828 [Ochlerotatus camptorhynchus]|uniref:uncharacterized protein LOC135709828 n=1 Tax=Ochlerotatus camptorhynchus TaxID=644619 RepID=UPI0031CE9E65
MNIDGKMYSVSLLQVNLDSVARCKVQNMKQYNGLYGCTYCLHPGETKVSNNSRCYPNMHNVRKREDTPTRELMEEVSTTGIEKLGVMGKSVFIFLPDFDIIDCFPPDYMHAILLGVMKQLWSLWTESENHKQPFYIGNRLGEIEKRMLSFRPPSVFPRYPRQLKEYKKYKANEWEAVLLHYLYPAVTNILPKQFLDHVMLLSSSIHQLLDPTLNEATIHSCDMNLNMFLQQFETLYGKDNMSYNVHLTGHIIEAVYNFGALYNFSLFPYESGNGMLLGFRTGNKSPLVQIERKYYMNKLCHRNYLDLNPDVKNWIQSLWSKQKSSVQYDPKGIYILNDNLMFDADVVERSFSAHGKMYSKSFNVCTKQTCHAHKYDDSWVYINENFYAIVEILCDQNNIVYIAGQQLHSKKLCHNIYSYALTDIIKVMRVNDTIRQCINMCIKMNDRSLQFISKCKIRTQID